MAIKAYIGLQGHGKSYEVVKNVILVAVANGRRVVSNISGLNFEEMSQYLVNKGHSLESLGEIVTVSHDDILKPDFFPTDRDIKLGKAAQFFVQGGDVVVLDEIWRFWPKRKTIPDQHLNFFRMHRHMLHEQTKRSCEIVMISQLIRDFHADIEPEQTFKMTKATAIGSTKRYRVDVYTGRPTRSDKPLVQYFHSYEPQYFPMYKSHSTDDGASGVEESVDKRGNILFSKRFVLVIPLILFAGIFAFNNLYNYFHPKVKSNEQATNPATDRPPSKDSPQTSPNAVPAEVPQPRSSWRIVGFYQKGQVITLVLRNDAGTTRYVIDPPNIRLAGLDIGAVLGTEVYSNWSGAEIQKRAP